MFTAAAVEITGFEDASREGAGVMSDRFEVLPAGASCEVSQESGIEATVSLSGNDGGYRTLSVDTGARTGEVTVEVSCSKSGHSSDTAEAVFTAWGDVEITGFDDRSRLNAGAMSGEFTVVPDYARCAERVFGTADVSWVSDSGTQRELSVTTLTDDGSATALVTCTAGGHRNDYAFASFRSYDRQVQITGLQDAIRTGAGTVADRFEVSPIWATCRLTAPSSGVSLSRISGAEHEISATLDPTDSVTAELTCNASTYADNEATATLAAEACTTALTLGPQSQTRRGAWSATASCVSSQRGNSQTPYYAKHYTFTLGTGADVTVTVAPATDEDPSPALYVLPAGSDEPQDSKEGEPDTYELPAGVNTIEVTTVQPRLTGTFTITFAQRGREDALTVTTPCPAGHIELNNHSCEPYPIPADLVVPTAEIPVSQRTFPVSRAALKGMVKAANDLLPQYACTAVPEDYRLTRNLLVALLVSISHHELYTVRDSPNTLMELSRHDHLNTRTDNPALYSLNDHETYQRAFWHPGVGLWQLDEINGHVNRKNHAERAHAETAANTAAEMLLKKYCAASADIYHDPDNPDPARTRRDAIDHLKKSLWRGTWVACSKKLEDGTRVAAKCYPTFESIISGDPFPQQESSDAWNGRLYLSVHELPKLNGGVESLTCRWSAAQYPGATFDCYMYDIENNAEGYWYDHCNIQQFGITCDQSKEGLLDHRDKAQHDELWDRSPLAYPFLSFTQESTKYVVFKHDDTSYRDEQGRKLDLIAAVPVGSDARRNTNKYPGPESQPYGWWRKSVLNEDDEVIEGDTVEVVGN